VPQTQFPKVSFQPGPVSKKKPICHVYRRMRKNIRFLHLTRRVGRSDRASNHLLASCGPPRGPTCAAATGRRWRRPRGPIQGTAQLCPPSARTTRAALRDAVSARLSGTEGRSALEAQFVRGCSTARTTMPRHAVTSRPGCRWYQLLAASATSCIADPVLVLLRCLGWQRKLCQYHTGLDAVAYEMLAEPHQSCPTAGYLLNFKEMQ
jgi:hypothetical protein